MRAVAMMAVLACACGHPQSAPPEPELVPPTPGPVDATPPPIPDAAPPDAAVPDAAPPDATPVACWDMGSSHRIVQTLRVRVTATGDDGVLRGKETWATQWAEAEIVDVIDGDMTKVDKRFRTSVYAITETHYCKKGSGCGFRAPDGEVAELIAAKGEERIVVMALPPQGSEWRGIPGRLRKKYGRLQPELLRVCPVP